MAVGDILPHRRVKRSALSLADTDSPPSGWTALFADVLPLLRDADIAFGNLEAPVAPDNHQGVHGEVFNAPAAMAGGLADAGFDVLAMANNHVWDQGAAGMLETRRRVIAAGMQPVGVGSTCAEAAAPTLVEAHGVRFAFVAATDLLNIHLEGGDDEPCVLLAGDPCVGDCGPDRDAVHFRAEASYLAPSLRAARQQADVVILSMHWGNEYRTVPLDEYLALAPQLIDAGADVVLGHHPHVLQPVVRHTAPDGREGVIAYSLGNFISDMASSFVPTDHAPRRGDMRDGMVLTVTFERVGDGPTRISDVGIVPTWTVNNRTTRSDDEPDHIAVVGYPTLGGPQGDADLAVQRAARVREVLGSDAPIRPPTPTP